MNKPLNSGTGRKKAAGLLADKSFQKELATMIASAAKTAVNAVVDEAGSQRENPSSQLFAPRINRGIDDRDKRKGHEKMAAMMRFVGLAKLATGTFAPDHAVKVAKEFGDEFTAKALTSIDFSAGGALVPSAYSTDIFEALRPMSKVRAMNPTILPMVEGSLVIPGITGGATASYKGEASGANATTVTTGDVRLVEKELIAIIPMSTSLMRATSGRAETAIGNDLLRAIAQAENTNFINGDGTQGKPLGIRNQMRASHSTATAGTTLDNIDTDLKNLRSTVRAANVPVDASSGGYLMNTTIEEALLSKRTPSGDEKAFAELEQGRLGRYKAEADNTMPSGVMIFGHWPDVIIGESETIEFSMSSEAAYQDSSGTVRAPFSRNEVVMRVICKHDIGLRYDVALAEKTSIAY